MAADIPFADIQSRAKLSAEALCRRWLPTGHRSGNWYLARCPWREDNTPSLGVSMTTGCWRDFATGEHGDMISLFKRLYGGDLVTAADAVAQIVGHEWRKRRAS